MSRRDPEPPRRIGFCQGCKRWDMPLNRVAISRYRCDDCALTDTAAEKPFTSNQGA